MRGKKIIWLSLIIPLLLALAVTDVASPTSTVLSVSPSSILDETLQSGSTFTVDINVLDVPEPGLKFTQVNMTWDPSMLNFTTAWEGDFINNEGLGNYTWHGKGYQHEVDPYAEQLRDPSNNDPEFLVDWNQPQRALADDNLFATCETADAEVRYWTFGFNTGALSGVTGLIVTVNTACFDADYNASAAEAEYLEIQVSSDSGSTWGINHTVPAAPTEVAVPIDVTYDHAWTLSNLNNLYVKMRYKEVGVNATTISVDYISATVIDALMVEMPSRTHDGAYDLATTLGYDQTGSFLVTDWGYNLPMGPATAPVDEESPILQVDFTIKYSATASGAGDTYSVVYYQPLEIIPTQHVLQTATSSATTLGNHTWTDVTEPDDGTWDWVEIDWLEFGFVTALGTGDPSATISIYEIWLTVTYERKTNLLGPVYDQDAGWCYVGVDTAYGYIWGATGSGWILTMEFEVLDYGYTDLDIETYETNLQDCGPPPNPPQDMEFTMQSGYFRNYYPGDIDGDWDCDYDDFNLFAAAYLKTSAHGGYNPLADFDYDGDVDYDDFNVFAANYLKTFP